MIKCIRCGKEIISASSGNARYIENSFDVRTHGPRKKTIFEVVSGEKVIDTETKLEKAQEKFGVEFGKKDKKVQDKLKEVGVSIKALEKASKELGGIEFLPVDDTGYAANVAERNAKSAEKNEKAAIANAKFLEVVELQSERSGVRLQAKDEIVTVAKTGIICLAPRCQDANDKIIW